MTGKRGFLGGGEKNVGTRKFHHNTQRYSFVPELVGHGDGDQVLG